MNPQAGEAFEFECDKENPGEVEFVVMTTDERVARYDKVASRGNAVVGMHLVEVTDPEDPAGVGTLREFAPTDVWPMSKVDVVHCEYSPEAREQFDYVGVMADDEDGPMDRNIMDDPGGDYKNHFGISDAAKEATAEAQREQVREAMRENPLGNLGDLFGHMTATPTANESDDGVSISVEDTGHEVPPTGETAYGALDGDESFGGTVEYQDDKNVRIVGTGDGDTFEGYEFDPADVYPTRAEAQLADPHYEAEGLSGGAA